MPCDDDAVSDADTSREHADRCPGVLRPWIADDGALVRLRLIGGQLTAQMLTDLMAISAEWADGTVLLTKRANLQLRGLAASDGCVDAGFVDAVTAAGFLPSPTHELVRNVMVSPLSGRVGGRADLFPVARQLDEALRDDPTFAGLSARFLFVFDDGRGDLIDRTLDLGAMAVDAEHAQIRIGSQGWGEVVELEAIPEVLLDLARRFVRARGEGPDAPWHVDELTEPLLDTHHARDLRTQVTSLRLPTGAFTQDDGRTAEVIDVPDGILTHDLSTRVLARAERDVVVTPWRSLVLPDLGDSAAAGVGDNQPRE
jgi:precorrin-3B synthase